MLNPHRPPRTTGCSRSSCSRLAGPAWARTIGFGQDESERLNKLAASAVAHLKKGEREAYEKLKRSQ